MKDPIAKLRQQLQQLKSQHEAGKLDAAAYASAKAPLERQLLDHVMTAGGGAAAADAAAARPSRNLVGLLSVAIVAVAVSGYLFTGSPGMPSAGPPGSAPPDAAAAHEGNGEQEFAAAVDKLAQRLKEEPDNAEGWAMLARSYARLGRHAEALPAFQRAVTLQAQDARLLTDYADTLAMQNGRELEGEPLKLIERALKIEPDNAKALALAGTAAFNRKDYKVAVKHWEHLAQVAPPDAGFIPQLQSSITEARSLGGMPKGVNFAQAQPAAPTLAATPAAVGAPADAPTPAAAAGVTLTGTVRLSPALAKQAAATDTVFIFARPAEGSRMPLAIQRHQVKDLPVQFKLDDSTAMSPASKLSLFPKVVISARVSKTGQAVPAPGDLTGQSAAVANTTSGLVVEINEVVKP